MTKPKTQPAKAPEAVPAIPVAVPTPDAVPSALAPVEAPPPEPDEWGMYAVPEVYDPAEYRWVPVRRRPRYDGWTEEKQRRFIEALADTGLVSLAAKSVGMSRESANRLRRSPHAGAFARAWDAARAQAGSVIEDIAFERALEGVEHNVYDENGEVVCTKRVYNDRLLMFLLGNLKPERYGRTARERAGGAAATPAGTTIEAEPCAALHESLAALEPALPAPAEALLDPETLEVELEIAEVGDGRLPDFLSEQREQKSAARLAAEAEQAQIARGKIAADKQFSGGKLDEGEFADMCKYLDPHARPERSRKRYR